jgi:hypothetical protein
VHALVVVFFRVWEFGGNLKATDRDDNGATKVWNLASQVRLLGSCGGRHCGGVH